MPIDPQAPDEHGDDLDPGAAARRSPSLPPGEPEAPADRAPRPGFPDPLQWWLERRRRKRRDPNPLAKGEPYRPPPLWQRLISIVALLLIAVVFGLILTAVVVIVVAALALALQSAIAS